jgi:twitching motility protein PilT
MSIPKISQIEFVDLYIGETYCDIKGFPGAAATRVPAPVELEDQIDALRRQCREHFADNGEPEFSLIVDDVVFRVTEMNDVTGGEVYVLRRSGAHIRQLATLGLAPHVMKAVLDQDAKGLILIAGEMGAGKTSTAASIVVQRLVLHGGIAIAVEDPPETKLNGLHGNGRCIQVQASRRSGGYQEHMVRAMRSGADMILIGEIRDEDTAYQALKASINGHTIVSTIHAGDIPQAIERLQTLCSERTANAYNILAEGLTVVIWQALEKFQRGSGTASRLVVKALVLGNDAQGIRSKIRKGQIAQIKQDIEDQSQQAAWNMQRALTGGRS